MRILLYLAVALVVIGGVLRYRNHEQAAQAATTSQLQPAAARTPSEHDWAKSALDRTADVKRQVAQKRKQDAAAE